MALELDGTRLQVLGFPQQAIEWEAEWGSSVSQFCARFLVFGRTSSYSPLLRRSVLPPGSSILSYGSSIAASVVQSM